MLKRHQAALYISFLCMVILPCYGDIILNTDVCGLPNAEQKNTNILLQQAVNNLPQPLTPELADQFYTYSNDTVAEGVMPYGYFTPQVTKKLTKKDSTWVIHYQVDPNDVTRISQVNLKLQGEGSNEKDLAAFLQNNPFKQGQPFLSAPYDDFKKQWLTAAENLGYIKASFTEHQVLVNRKNHKAEIHLTLDTGHRYYFAAIHFQKNPLSNEFLERFVSFRPGKPYSTQDISQLQADLSNSSYFSNVSVVPEPNSTNYTVPVNVYLTPRPQKRYILGAGYGTDTGPRATLGSNWNYVNRYGHQFNALLRLSQVQSAAIAKYIIPGKHPLTDQYNVNASLQTYNYTQGTSQVRQVGGGYTLTRGKWQRSFNLSYQIEHYSFNNNPYLTSHLLLPGFNLQYLNSDNVLTPTRGSRFNVNFIAAKEGFGSDTSLTQVKVSEKWLYPFNPNNMILLRTDLGYTTIHDITKLPLSLSFFAGGAQSVRGYGFNTLGPGRYLVVGSAEYRYRVHGNWFAATFIDVGNAFNNFPQANNSTLKSRLGALYNSLNRGVGVGVVWNSPVGPMQLSLAQAVTTPGKPNRIQFNMGTDL